MEDITNNHQLGWFHMCEWMSVRRVIKTCTWQILGVIWFMGYALVTGGDIWYTFGLSMASIPAGAVMFYTHEWIWDKL